ncbi:MAG: hypothetical protein WCR72_17925 [Bacteroidota bacterium]
MASTSETGHAKNEANFRSLTAFASSYGADYNPSNGYIQLPALQSLSQNAGNALLTVNSTLSDFKKAAGNRRTAFAPLNILSTRILNALMSSGADENLVANAKTLVHKIKGERITPRLTEEEKAALKAEGKESNESSSSQLSFDNRLDNFDKLVKLLGTATEYKPNEPELQLTSLSALYTIMYNCNQAVIDITAVLSQARVSRNEIFYSPLTGLFEVATTAKKYVKSLYGAGSERYRQVAGIIFTDYSA